MNNKLSVVIIAKNEECNIKRSIESILEATAYLGETEIVLVDSFSTDQTIDIAKNYPIKIIQLDPNFFISPSAGRFIGLKYTSGEFIYFLDGDMHLNNKWFETALPLIENNPKLVGIAGKCHEITFDDNFKNITSEDEDRFNVGNQIHSVRHLGQSVLYRRSALEKVGGFNPYLSNEEELELGLRLSAAKYELQRIPVPMTIHYTKYYSNENPSGVTIRQLKRDWNLGRHTALGQVLGLLWKNPFLMEYLRLYWKSLLFLAVYFIGILTLVIGSTYFLIWFTLFMLFFSLRAIIKKNAYDTTLYILSHSMSAYGFVIGLFKMPPNADVYQPQLKFIK
jgi:glycosyltransferase involved in cell wall biosynthesis